jgi:hypothetical protein
MVAVDTRDRVANASGVRDIEKSAPVGIDWRRILRGTAIASSGLGEGSASRGAIITSYHRHAD